MGACLVAAYGEGGLICPFTAPTPSFSEPTSSARQDRIVVFLTRDRGKKRGVAKGARRPKSNFVGALEPLTHARVAYFEKERRELVNLNYSEASRSVLSSGTIEGLGCATYFAELIDEWAPRATRTSASTGSASSMVEAIAAGVPSEPLTRYFEYWLLSLQGVYPAGRVPSLSPEAQAFLAAARKTGPAGVRRRDRRSRDAARARVAASQHHRDASRARAAVAQSAKGHDAFVTLQDLILKLSAFWASQGCIIQQPLDLEVGAGTSHPETLLRVLGPKPWNVAYVQPSRRPDDGPVRREPQPPLQAPSVAGDSEARAR
jgi:hypothetical protein